MKKKKDGRAREREGEKKGISCSNTIFSLRMRFIRLSLSTIVEWSGNERIGGLKHVLLYLFIAFA